MIFHFVITVSIMDSESTKLHLFLIVSSLHTFIVVLILFASENERRVSDLKVHQYFNNI
jgi:hypothetical protein